MAGVAMAFSLQKQEQQGVPWMVSFRKTLKRCGWLFFWGVLLYAVKRNGLAFELWNVLTQLSFTTLVAFLIFRWSFSAQAAFCAGLLLLTEALYRFTHVPGFDQPFTNLHNFGNYADTLLMNKIDDDGWVAINCIPTAVHTIAGAMAGKMLQMNPPSVSIPGTQSGIYSWKIKQLLLWAAGCLVLGFALDLTGVTPIIKRIATSSFTLVSLGYTLLILAACYWWIDARDHRKGLQFFLIVGMNSIFIYLFFSINDGRWFNHYIETLAGGLLKLAGAGEMVRIIFSSLCIFGLEWGICYFLYKHKIFFKL
jgi:predicted acyltransferase